MHIKRFEAPTLVEAIQRVKSELGPHALVLSQRTVRRGGRWFGVGASSVVEIVAAVDRDVRREPAASPGGRAPARADEGSPRDPGWKMLPVTKALLDPLESELRSQRRLLEGLSRSLPERADLQADVEAIRGAAADLRRGMGAAGEGAADELAIPLLRAGLSPRHAYRLAERAQGREASAGRDGIVGEEAAALRAALSAALDGRMRPRRPDERVRVEMFVGPTGVGKTTTLAKVAGRAASEGEGDLALVSTDVERLGGDAALSGYAKRIGLPFARAASPDDLAAQVRRHRGRVLIDTEGRSPADPEALARLAAFRDALGLPARVHLVVSATTKEEDLRRQLQRFRALEPDGLVVTKLDESRRVGNVVNLILDDSPSLVWLADGQRVPADLLLPDPDELAARALAHAGHPARSHLEHPG
ncbi:MAG: hypothetical protein QNK04_05670 [Myxococcota bacterium]|nr:hypothetical protein [Myxococcota bacterium]